MNIQILKKCIAISASLVLSAISVSANAFEVIRDDNTGDSVVISCETEKKATVTVLTSGTDKDDVTSSTIKAVFSGYPENGVFSFTWLPESDGFYDIYLSTNGTVEKYEG